MIDINFWIDYGYYLLFLLETAIIVVSYREVKNRIKLFWLRRKGALIEFVGPDAVAVQIAVKKDKDGKTFLYDDCKFILNPRKAKTVRGVKVFTYVMNNALAHDFLNDPAEVFRKLIHESKQTQEVTKTVKKGFLLWKKKEEKKEVVKDITDQFHDVFSEPYRVDGRLLQEVIINAQLSNATVFDEIIKLFKSKNFITIAIIALALSAAAAGLGWMTYSYLQKVPVCQVAAQAATNINV